jgi:thiol-disulfide isomerase/thioredoxin
VIAEVDKVMSPADRQMWLERVAQLSAEGLRAADTPSGARFYFDFWPVRRQIRLAGENKLPPGAPEWEQFGRELVRLAETHPREQGLFLVSEYQAARLPMGSEAAAPLCRPVLEALAKSPNASMAEEARTQLKNLELVGRPIAFTAVDGREVDVGKMKGKVVLIDFWATWCGPCIAELPNVKKVYAAYHAKGFEVVGIALENASLAPSDTPEQTAAKMAKAKKVLTDFTAKHELPWPQYMDGKYFKTDFAARYNIQGIPAMFLIGQDGKIVSTDARGPKLEQEVKRLLKL